MRCSGCLVVAYCSQQCQHVDWVRAHRAACSSRCRASRAVENKGACCCGVCRCPPFGNVGPTPSPYRHPYAGEGSGSHFSHSHFPRRLPRPSCRPDVKPTVALTTRTALSSNVVKFGQRPAGCLPTARHERNVAFFVWRLQVRGPFALSLIKFSSQIYLGGSSGLATKHRSGGKSLRRRSTEHAFTQSKNRNQRSFY